MRHCVLTVLAVLLASSVCGNANAGDHLRDLQQQAVETRNSDWGYWGADPGTYSTWTSHSNRLIPVYSFGIDLKRRSGENSVYCDPKGLKRPYGSPPEGDRNLTPRTSIRRTSTGCRSRLSPVERQYPVRLRRDGLADDSGSSDLQRTEGCVRIGPRHRSVFPGLSRSRDRLRVVRQQCVVIGSEG